MVLGAIRIRQVRSKASKCLNATNFITSKADCYPAYKKGDSDDRTGFSTSTGVWFPYRNASDLEDDGTWQSPSTLVMYDAGGYVDDLPVGVSAANARLDQLQAMSFIDAATRAVFMDFSLYCPNNDQFLSARVLFEFAPSGAILPFMELIPAALLTDVRAIAGDESALLDRAKFVFEMILYVTIVAYLMRASDKIAQYKTFANYIKNVWNALDILNVGCFLAVIAIRVFWMLKSYKLEYDVTVECLDESKCLADAEFDDESYVPIRSPVVYYSYGKTFFAFGTLLSFLKTFRFLGVSRRLSIFSDTISRAFEDVCLLMIIFGVIIAGFGVGFHVAFGASNRDFMDFRSASLSLVLLSLGDFEVDSLRETNPFLGMVLFAFYAILVVFVILTMMLKIVDSAFHDMRRRVVGELGTEANLALQVKFALRKIFHDWYWRKKAHSVVKAAKLTEKIIDSMNKAGAGMESLAGKKDKKHLKHVDDSILELVEVEAKKKREETEKAKEEEERRKKEEKKAKRKKMTKAERQKRRQEREAERNTNVPENRRLVRDAIKQGKVESLKEEQIDRMEISDRLDMMEHRSEIISRSCDRLLDQILILAEEASAVKIEGDDADIVPKKQDRAPPYGRTGELFGLQGVKEPVLDHEGGEASITDLNQGEGEHFVMKIPKKGKEIEAIDEKEGQDDDITDGDVADMYKSLGYKQE